MIHFAIHDCNQRGGQDRSTLEIVRRLAEHRAVRLHAFTFESDSKNHVEFRPVRLFFHRPALGKIVYYHAVTLLRLLRARRTGIVCATGACALVSDVVHVQFVHAAWSRRGEERGLYAKLVSLYNRFTERLTFREGKTFIAISEAVKADLEREYALGRIEVVHHGVDAQRFRPAASASEVASLRERLGLPAGKFLCLFVGSFERKGLATVLEATAQLHPDLRGNLEVLAVGAGDPARYHSLAANLGIGNIVRIFPPSAEIESYFRAADAFIFPTTYEPFGLVILEAMASGLPTITSRAAGAAELIRPGENGLLLEDPASAREISAHLTMLLTHPDQREEIARAARKTALDRSWDQVAREYEQVLVKWHGA